MMKFLKRGAKEPEIAAWKGPVIQVASMCQHLGDNSERHRLVVMDLEGLVRDLSPHLAPYEFIINLGGLRMGSFGIVLSGFVAVDVFAVMRNVVWEDEHCLRCCGALLSFVEPLHHKLLVRCGPTIGRSVMSASEVIDEYWTD